MFPALAPTRMSTFRHFKNCERWSILNASCAEIATRPQPYPVNQPQAPLQRGTGWRRASARYGAAADIASFDLAQASFAGRVEDSVLGSWIFASNGPAVDTVWRYGRK